MNRAGKMGAVWLAFVGASTVAPITTGAERRVLIVAGQSNVLNWHAHAAALPAHAADQEIAFYFHTGAPPSKAAGMTPPFNATSGGTWTTLRAQRQHPYVRYAREFFGPEMSLGRTLHDGGGATRWAIIKVGYFGTNLAEDWQPDATAGNRLYRLLLAQLRDALKAMEAAGDTPRVSGFFWMQGETDGANEAHAAAYERNLRLFIARVREDVIDGDKATAGDPLPFVLARVGPRPKQGYTYQDVVRAAQVRVAESESRVAWVNTDDLRRDTDGVHLLAPGVLTLGERWANAWSRLR